MSIRLSYFQRRPSSIHFSLEFLFDGLRQHLPTVLSVNTWIAPWFSTGLWPRLKIMLDARKNQGDINHITGDIHFIALALKKRKTILTIHDLGILNNSSNPIVKWVLKTFWITLPVQCVQLVTVVSEATKQELLRHTKVNPTKIRVIGNFISPLFKQTPKLFNTHTPRILHIGSAHNKNLDRLIEAVTGIPCVLVIIGYPTPEQKEALRKNKIKHEILNGLTQQQLIEQYQQCDLLAFVSLLEGFGLPILEAQAIGRPVLTSNISSMPEVAGEGACLVDPYSISSIQQGIHKISSDAVYRERLIKNGYVNSNRFSPQKITQQYVDLYYEVYMHTQR